MLESDLSHLDVEEWIVDVVENSMKNETFC